MSLSGYLLEKFNRMGSAYTCRRLRSDAFLIPKYVLGTGLTPFSSIVQRVGLPFVARGLDFMGIDLLFGDDKPYFCEINVMPGIEGMEEASGKNLARLILETIRGDF